MPEQIEDMLNHVHQGQWDVRNELFVHYRSDMHCCMIWQRMLSCVLCVCVCPLSCILYPDVCLCACLQYSCVLETTIDNCWTWEYTLAGLNVG